MNVFRQAAPKLRPWMIAVFPLVFWAMLLLSLQAGNVKDILRPGSPGAFIQGLRAILPLLAGVLAAVLILAKLSRQRQGGGTSAFGPLGLTAIYGLVGVASALLSPDGSVALYWATAYLSVPLVLWAIIWGTDALDSVRRVVNFNWLIIILAAAALFAVSLTFLHLGSIITTPSLWLDCKLYGQWRGDYVFSLTSGLLRPTGVGRYAAIAAIIALGGMWQRGRWFLWGPALAASLILLFSSGARGAFVGFAGGAALVVLLYAGKKAIAFGAMAMIIVVPLVWVTGVPREFVDNCLRLKLERIPQATVQHQNPASAPLLGTDRLASNEPSLGTDRLASNEPSLGADRLASNEPSLGTDRLASKETSEPEEGEVERRAPSEILNLSGRIAVWAEGWELFKRSPFLGWGFHADRLLLGTHMHNTLLHVLIQTGLIGSIPFMAALVWAWVLQIKVLRNRAQLPAVHRHLVIQVAGVLAFLSLRAIPESTGAFFGVDWLLLAPMLLYLQVVNELTSAEQPAL